MRIRGSPGPAQASPDHGDSRGRSGEGAGSMTPGESPRSGDDLSLTCRRAWPRWVLARQNGATITVIDHDLDLLAVAGHLIDRAPGGGPAGGRVLCAWTPGGVARAPGAVSWPACREHLSRP